MDCLNILNCTAAELFFKYRIRIEFFSIGFEMRLYLINKIFFVLEQVTQTRYIHCEISWEMWAKRFKYLFERCIVAIYICSWNIIDRANSNIGRREVHKNTGRIGRKYWSNIVTCVGDRKKLTPVDFRRGR